MPDGITHALDAIVIKGAREHNLKNVDLTLPRNKLIVVTGLSGSGKSSLAFDTIYAEGQRRYVESLSSYARQFLGQMEKPDVDYIEGLSPAISIDQKSTSRNPRSTVGTVTEIYDYLRLLYARIGVPHCYECGREISSQTAEQIVDQILAFPEGTRIQLLAPVIRGRKGEYTKLVEEIGKEGFARVRVDGEIRELKDKVELDKKRKHTVEVVVDRLVVKPDVRTRLTDSIETTLKLSTGIVTVLYQPLDKLGMTAVKANAGTAKPAEVWTEASSDYVKEEIEKYMSASVCKVCKGARLKPESLGVTIADRNIDATTKMSVEAAEALFAVFQPNEREAKISHQILKEIRARLGFLKNVGLGYLNLSRSATTLSGGESQRIRLATQIGSSLVGVLYILDEPSIGLHQRDNDRLLATLETLRDIGNTLIVIEHDEDTMRSADIVVDIGPGAGAEGGRILSVGTIADMENNPESLTGAYLSGRQFIAIPKHRKKGRSTLRVIGAKATNVRGVDVDIPLGTFACVTGVSGSGKSTLVNEVVVKALNQYLHHQPAGGTYGRVKGAEALDKMVVIDQSPIGRTPRSNPATYTGAFDLIRELYSLTPEAKMRGYTQGRFSFNVKGGRCEACTGDGIIKIEMHFLPDVYVPCEVCKGKRYNAQTLEVKYKGKTISDVLEMRVDEANAFFESVPRIHNKLRTICDVGLGYIKMGQPATTLSGGEAQRVKLATELSRRSTGRTFYVLDEPTTGLHFADIHKLLEVLQRLVGMGNTVLVIEHNLDVIKTADHLIDLGPEGGDKGGNLVATGTPEEIAANPASHTGEYLNGVLTDERAKGRIRVSAESIAKLENANFETLDDLTKNGRIPVEA